MRAVRASIAAVTVAVAATCWAGQASGSPVLLSCVVPQISRGISPLVWSAMVADFSGCRNFLCLCNSNSDNTVQPDPFNHFGGSICEVHQVDGDFFERNEGEDQPERN